MNKPLTSQVYHAGCFHSINLPTFGARSQGLFRRDQNPSAKLTSPVTANLRISKAEEGILNQDRYGRNLNCSLQKVWPLTDISLLGILNVGLVQSYIVVC